MPRHVLTVAEITAYIKSRFTSDELLGDVWLSGEISNFKQHTSGHCYFTLKDAASSIKAVLWRTTAGRIALPRDGDAVVAHGYISVYEPQGTYQLYVDHVEAAGVGRLWMEFERLKARLEGEGLFDPEIKRPVPKAPVRVGIVTSPTGAALRDILRTLASRYPLVDVILAPSLVQGDTAPPAIAAAIQALNRWSAAREKLDAIIVARGGGSIEELWAFNDERVARAIRGSAIPVITGIGHETDFTIADFAADLRAPTPTGAATLAVPDRADLRAAVAGLQTLADTHTADNMSRARMRLDAIGGRLARLAPTNRLASERQRMDELSRQAHLALSARLSRARERLTGQMMRLNALDPARVLERGYALVTAEDGALVSSTAHVSGGDAIRVRVKDGAFGATVTKDGRETAGDHVPAGRRPLPSEGT